MNKALISVLLTVFFSAPAQAVSLTTPVDDLAGLFDYQIGSEWGKLPVTPEDLSADTHFARMALATARVGRGGTGFYLGEFNGRHIVATNHHVCPMALGCLGERKVRFTELGIAANVVEFLGTWSTIELALLVIQVPNAADLARLRTVGVSFAFDKELRRGQKLVTIGYGIAGNPLGQLVANRDQDCVVFSGDAEYRLMGDPDEFNPGDYEVESFANGCDVSHGDSGSAMMDRETGDVVGIIWTGRIPKNPKVRSGEYLQGLLQNPTEDIWHELSYGVPASTMRTYLNGLLANGSIGAEIAPTLRAILQ